jgi:23S rRNA (cytosine1962-C5)-methyltransferase
MPYPQLRVARSAAKRIRHFDCWVFRDELTGSRDALRNGEVVELADEREAFLAYAFYSSRSHIAARVVSTDRAQPVDHALIAGRLTAALARRGPLSATSAARLVFSEADGLPGLIVDRYGRHLVLQTRTAGMDAWKPAVVELLRTMVRPQGILERSDKEFREEEGLAPAAGVLDGSVPERLRIEEDGLAFWVDPYRGHKTGFYLDQRDTRRWLRERISPGERVADVFAYTGAFGIAAAARGARVICVEQDESCLALARENAALNGVAERMEFVAGDAFYWLEAKASGRGRMDWVLLDPPSLAKSRADILKGRQALHRLAVHGLGLLGTTGTLALSVCTYHLLPLAEEILRIAAEQQAMRLRVRAVTLQATDHPWVLQMPMTRYLMSWMAQRDG